MSRTEGLTEDGQAGPSAVRIEVVTGPSSPAPFELTAGSMLIGSGDGCDLRLDDGAVSRQHARIELLGGGQVRVVDLGSTNGTRYLGARITQATVPIGGELKVGRTTLRLRAPSREAISARTELVGLKGASLPMQRLFAVLEKLGPADVSVLIRGETGVGKGAAARALHELSPRAAEPFVTFDCGAVNPNLIETALFGQVKGAFTGADVERAGVLEQAGAGTLFLDEVGELPQDLQPKLLRALDAREFTRVGEHVPRAVRCRFLSATHRDLEARGFRSDLFFRLAQTSVVVPPLRERREDVALLARHFAQRSKASLPLTPSTIAALQAEPWPGNVRELQNAVERALTLGFFQDTAAAPRNQESFSEARAEIVRRFEHDYLAALLAQHGGNLSEAARAAGLARSHLYRLLERHQLGARE